MAPLLCDFNTSINDFAVNTVLAANRQDKVVTSTDYPPCSRPGNDFMGSDARYFISKYSKSITSDSSIITERTNIEAILSDNFEVINIKDIINFIYSDYTNSLETFIDDLFQLSDFVNHVFQKELAFDRMRRSRKLEYDSEMNMVFLSVPDISLTANIQDYSNKLDAIFDFIITNLSKSSKFFNIMY